MKATVVLYPFCHELLPVVRHFSELQDCFSLYKLISLPGLGLTGHDAAYACNYPQTGYIVEESIDFSDSKWDTIILIQTLDEEIAKKSELETVAENALTAGKKVVYYGTLIADIPPKIFDLLRSNPLYMSVYTSDSDLPLENREVEGYCSLDAPVILIGGLIAEADVFEVLLGLVSRMREDGLRPMVFARSPIGRLFGFHNITGIYKKSELSEEKKICALNSQVKLYENAARPDIIVIEAPDALIRFNDIAPNGFGIQTYMLAQAILLDFCICCVPCEFADISFISALSNDFSIRLGTQINIVHVSNIIVDSADLLQSKRVSFVHADIREVGKMIHKNPSVKDIPILDAVTDNETEVFYEVKRLLQT